MKHVICRATVWVSLFLAVCPLPASAGPDLTFSTVKDAHFKPPIVEIMTQAYQRLGYRMKVVEQSTQRSLIDAGQGVYDGNLFRIRGIDRAYPDLIMVDVPCCKLDVYLYVPPKKRFTVTGWESIPRGYTMVAPFAVKYIDMNIKAHGIPTFFVKTPEETLGFLLSGKADFTLSTRALDSPIFARGLDKKLIRLTPAVERIQLFHYLHNKNAGLVKQVGDTLRAMHRDGSIAAIVSRWEKIISLTGDLKTRCCLVPK